MREMFEYKAQQLADALMKAGVSFDGQDDEIKEAVKNHPAFTKLGEREFTTVLMTFWRMWELGNSTRVSDGT